MSTCLKVAIVGCGAVAELYYAPALKVLEKEQVLSVTGLFDPAKERVGQLQKHFPAATIVSGLEKLSDLAVELVIISSPPVFHARQSIQCIKSGFSVLCEKPMAMNVAEAQEMMAQAQAAGKILAVGLVRRFFPALQAIKEALSTQILGPVSTFSFLEGTKFSWPATPAAFDKKQAGGGVLMDIGIHIVDLMLWWFGEPDSVQYEDDAMGGVEANCRLKIAYDDGIEGTVLLSRDWDLPNHYLIQCERGWLGWQVGQADAIELGFGEHNLAVTGQVKSASWKKTRPFLRDLPPDYGSSFIYQLLNVASAIKGEEELVVSGSQAVKSLKLIESCYDSGRIIDMPWLSEEEYNRGISLKALR